MEQPENLTPPSTPQNGKLAILQTLASSGDSWVKLGTLILVGISGLGNFLTTKETGRATRAEVDTLLHQVNEIHERQANYLSHADQIPEIERLTRENQAAISQLKTTQTWFMNWMSRHSKDLPPDF